MLLPLGGDGPEALADALNEVKLLSWRPQSTKISVIITDAAPHGLDPDGDGFPNGNLSSYIYPNAYCT